MQGNLRGTSPIHSQYVAQPSDSSAFDFHNNAPATSFSVKVPIRDLIWPEDATDFSETPIVEGLKFAHVILDDTPALRTVQQDIIHIAVIESDLGLKTILF